MRDLILIAFLAAMMGIALRRPFLFTLVYLYIDLLSPQRLSYTLLNSVPLSLIAFLFALGGYIVFDKKTNSRFSVRQLLLLIFLAYCGYTTAYAEIPDAALEKWDWVWKSLIFAMFLPLTLTTKLRIEALSLFLVLCAGTLIITGAIKTVLGGGGYGVLKLLVNNNSGIFEGSTISMIAIAIIPLILWLARYGTIYKPNKAVTFFAAALIFSCLLIPIGTQARTGVVCAVALAALFLRFNRYRFVYLIGAVALTAISIPFLPAAFQERITTITDYSNDESASTRIAVWAWTWNYVQKNPVGGGFDVYRKNKLQYELPFDKDTRDPYERFIYGPRTIVDEARAFHSSYFEVLGEQGFFGLTIWLIIQAIGLVRMSILRRRYNNGNKEDEWIPPLALALQNGHIIFLVGSLFIGVAYQPFIFMMLGLQIGLDNYLSRRSVNRIKASQISDGLRPQTQTG